MNATYSLHYCGKCGTQSNGLEMYDVIDSDGDFRGTIVGSDVRWHILGMIGFVSNFKSKEAAASYLLHDPNGEF